MAVRKGKYIGEKRNIFHSPYLANWYEEKVTKTRFEWTLDWIHLWNEVLYFLIIAVVGYLINLKVDYLGIDTDYLGFAVLFFLHKTLLK